MSLDPSDNQVAESLGYSLRSASTDVRGVTAATDARAMFLLAGLERCSSHSLNRVTTETMCMLRCALNEVRLCHHLSIYTYRYAHKDDHGEELGRANGSQSGSMPKSILEPRCP